MPEQIADQAPIVRNFSRPLAVADAGRLHHRLIIAHDVDQTDKAVVQHGKFLPPQCGDLLGVGRHGKIAETEIGGGEFGRLGQRLRPASRTRQLASRLA